MNRELLTSFMPSGASSVEVIIPVYNEELILRDQLLPVLNEIPSSFTVTVVENGSTDGTIQLLGELAGEYGQLQVVNLPDPNYGLALKEGLLQARADIVIIDDLDVLDLDFWVRGLKLLEEDGVDLVQGSKVLAGKMDRRPFIRRAATLTLTFLLKVMLGFRGTDTHGPKVMWRDAVKDIPPLCCFELDIFPTELVVRAQRMGVGIRETAIHLKEIRDTPLPLYKRVPRALRDIWRLSRSLRKK